MACSGESNQEVGEAIVEVIAEASQNNQANTADPVNVVTGAFLHTEHDVVFPSRRLSVALTRHYNNQLHNTDGDPRLHPFGPGWTFSYGLRIERRDEDCLVYIDDCGAVIQFVFDPTTGTFRSPPGSLGMHITQKEDDGFRLRQITGLTAEFNSAGRIVALIQPGPRQDSRLEFQYDSLDRLSSVLGAGSRGLQFHYESGDFLIRQVSDHTIRQWSYLYNEHCELVEVGGPCGRTRRYEYGEWKGRIATDRKTSREESLRALRCIYPYVSQRENSKVEPQVKNSYTTEQRVYLQVDAMGAQTRFEYNPFTRTTGVTDPAGNTTLYCFDEVGSTTKVRRPSGATMEYVFDDRRNVIAEIDSLGNRTEYVDFKDPSRLDEQVEYGNRATGNRSGYMAFSSSDFDSGYDSDGNRSLRRDGLGQVTRFEDYTRFGKPGRIVLPDGSTILTEYDDRSGLPLRQVKQLSKGRNESLFLIEEWLYDDFGNCTRHRTWAENKDGSVASAYRIKATEFDDVGQHVVRERTWIEEGGEGEFNASETRFQWDTLGRLVERVSFCKPNPDAPPKTQVIQRIYDDLGRMICEILPDAAAKYWVYDLNDLLLETFVTKEAQTKIPTEVPDALRLWWNRWEYDAAGREIKHIDPSGNVTCREWDPRGLCSADIDHLGVKTTYSYDRDSNLVKVCNDRAYALDMKFDANGKLIGRNDNLGASVNITRDQLGRTIEVSQSENSRASVCSYRYDLRGNISEIRWPDDTYELLNYDEFNNLVRRQQGDSNNELSSQEIREYDGLGRLLNIYLGSSNKLTPQFRYEYDTDRAEIKAYDALGNVTVSSFDSGGNLVSRVDAEGGVLRFDYNELGQLVHRWSDDGSVDSTYEYEVGGLPSLAVEGEITHSWQYDQSGRIIRHNQKVSSESRSIEYTYDNAGRLASKTMDDRWWMKFTYGSSRFPSSIELPGNSIQLVYDSGERLVAEQWQDGGRSTYEYFGDGSLRLLRRQDGLGDIVFSQLFERDVRKRPVQEIRRMGTSETKHIYRYDALGRLINVDLDEEGRSTSFRRYVYDERGNRLEEYRQGLLNSSYQYDVANRIVQITTADGSALAYEHDRCGNLVSGNSRVFRYDAAHRLKQVLEGSNNDSLATYHFAATGDLAIVENADSTNRIFYDGPQEVVFGAGTDCGVTFWGSALDALIATAHGESLPKRAYTDSLDSLIGVGQQVSLQEYDQFGESVSNEDSKFRYGFCSKVYDSRIGLYYNRARFYDPKLGRFTQPDPMSLIDGANVYLYSQNNPLQYVDRSGFKAEQKSYGRILEIAPALAFFPGQKDGRSDMVRPGMFESRGHMKHYDANRNLLGQSFIVDPGMFETRPHVEHFDTNWNLVGTTYVEGPGFFASLVSSETHFQHYNADREQSGRTYKEGPGFIESFFTSEPHFQHYTSDWERSGKTYLEGPGFIESFVTSTPHLQHYA